MTTLVIAEAGSCHDGDIEKAYRLIRTAAECGADVCKFQYYSSAERLAERRNAPEYLPIYKRYQVPTVWLSWLHLACRAAGVEFMATVYLPEDIEVIAPWVSRFKVASFEAMDNEFIGRHGSYGKQVIVSTGMTDGEEFMEIYGPGVEDLQILHCVSAYPTPLDQASLRCVVDGYSDHTADIHTGGLAVAAGAEILEVHFRLFETSVDNPDRPASLNPSQLKEYVSFVRKAELMLGDGVKRPQEAEKPMMKYRVKP